jgi:hypothetical protein
MLSNVSKPKKQLIVRLLPEVNRDVRERTRMFGDLGDLIEASVMIFDWNTLNATAIKTGRNAGQQVEPATTVSVTQECYELLCMDKAKHGVSINSLVNIALASWLKENPSATLKSWLRQQHETAFPGIPYEA